MLTIEDLHTQNLLLLEAISGSRAYGLATPESDTDIKGVFYLPKSMFYSMEYIPQISNGTNDIVYYELGGFYWFLLQSNLNTLELLASPDCDELLAIKRGESSYKDLLGKAEQLMAEVETAFDAANLPETVNAASALAALIKVREQVYG